MSESVRKWVTSSVTDPEKRRQAASVAAATALGTAGNVVAQHGQNATSQYYCDTSPAVCPLQDVAIHASDAAEQHDPSAAFGYHPVMDRTYRDSTGLHHTTIVQTDVTIPYHTPQEYAGSGLLLGALAISLFVGGRRQRNRPQRHNFH